MKMKKPTTNPHGEMVTDAEFHIALAMHSGAQTLDDILLAVPRLRVERVKGVLKAMRATGHAQGGTDGRWSLTRRGDHAMRLTAEYAYPDLCENGTLPCF